MKIKKHKVPLYFEKIRIVVTNNPAKLLKKENIKYDFDVNIYEAFVQLNKKDTTLYIRPKAKPSIIAHEAVHIVNEIFKRVQIRPDLDNDEPQAYLMGWIVDKIHKAIK